MMNSIFLLQNDKIMAKAIKEVKTILFFNNIVTLT